MVRRQRYGHHRGAGPHRRLPPGTRKVVLGPGSTAATAGTIPRPILSAGALRFFDSTVIAMTWTNRLSFGERRSPPVPRGRQDMPANFGTHIIDMERERNRGAGGRKRSSVRIIYVMPGHPCCSPLLRPEVATRGGDALCSQRCRFWRCASCMWTAAPPEYLSLVSGKPRSSQPRGHPYIAARQSSGGERCPKAVPFVFPQQQYKRCMAQHPAGNSTTHGGAVHRCMPNGSGSCTMARTSTGAVFKVEGAPPCSGAASLRELWSRCAAAAHRQPFFRLFDRATIQWKPYPWRRFLMQAEADDACYTLEGDVPTEIFHRALF